MPGDNKNSFLDWLVQGAQDARDAKIGAIGAGTVRQLYNEGKSEEAQEMAKNLAIQQGTALINFIPAGFAANKGLPWVMTNMALPVLGGEVVNEITRKVSDNKYDSFGDFVYHNTPLSRLKDGTDSNIFVKGFSEMLNPAYLFPYGNAIGSAMDGLQSLTNAYNNLPIKIKFTPRENFRYRNIGGNNEGVKDLITSGVVRPPSNETLPKSKTILLRKTFTIPFFGHKGKMVDAKSYAGKWFIGTEDFGNFYRPKRNQWGYTSKEPLTINDVTINRRLFPKMTNSPYVEINKIPRLISNAIRIKNMKMGYTGVPGNFMENFPKYTGRIWLTDNINLANHFAIRPPKPEGKIFKVFYEPAKNKVVSAPKYDHLTHWKYLPYDFVDSQFIPNSNFNINNIKFKTGNIPIIKNNTINTADDIVNKVFNSDYNILELPNIYEGVSMGFVNGKPTYFNTLKNTDTILKENTPHVVLPINENKWSLLFKDIDKLLVK